LDGREGLGGGLVRIFPVRVRCGVSPVVVRRDDPRVKSLTPQFYPNKGVSNVNSERIKQKISLKRIWIPAIPCKGRFLFVMRWGRPRKEDSLSIFHRTVCDD